MPVYRVLVRALEQEGVARDGTATFSWGRLRKMEIERDMRPTHAFLRELLASPEIKVKKIKRLR
jgi:hypothetical protein